MPYRVTTALRKISKLKKRLKIIQGGSSAGKSIAILLLLIQCAQTRERLLISIVSATFPHLKKGVMRDFLNIMEEHGYYEDAAWNRTDSIYTFPTGTKIEFFSADQPGKVRGPRRDELFINECNLISLETYTQLAIRTNGGIFLDYNPLTSFWVHDEIVPKQDHDFLILTYRDNEALSPAIVHEIEGRRGNANFWRVYGEGQVGISEGRIYKDWQSIDAVPHEAKLLRRGLDFGYTNDPTAIVDVYRWNGSYIFDELVYQTDLKNRQIAEVLRNAGPSILVKADSAEPKSIDEIREYGILILSAMKGPGSVNRGIQFVQDQRIFVTKRSVNLWKEHTRYFWKTDKDGKILNVPEVGWDHAMDAIRYALEDESSAPSVQDTFHQQAWESDSPYIG